MTPCCQYGVDYSERYNTYDDCGDKASHRISYDGGVTWVYLCALHAEKVARHQQIVNDE